MANALLSGVTLLLLFLAFMNGGTTLGAFLSLAAMVGVWIKMRANAKAARAARG